MRFLLLSLSLCIATNLLSQRTVRPNSYITTNISYDSDPENKKINRLNNLKGKVSSLTSYVYNISRGDRKAFDKKSSFKYAFKANAVIETEWKFKAADLPDEKIGYHSFIKNRPTKIESYEMDGEVNATTYTYDKHNRLIKKTISKGDQVKEEIFPTSTEDSLDVFLINGYRYKYDEDWLISIEQEHSKIVKRYEYRNDHTLKYFGTYKRVKDAPNRILKGTDGILLFCQDGVSFTHKGLVRGVWKNSHSADHVWLSSIGSNYKYNEGDQVIQKRRWEMQMQTGGWQRDSTLFSYKYNDEKLLTSIIKENNQINPMVTFDYNEHGDLIYSKYPAGELKYTYSDYDTFNNWRTREKYLNDVLQTREERIIEYFDK